MKALAEALKYNNTLTELVFYHNDISATGAKVLAEALKKNNTLTNLWLSYYDIGDKGLKVFESLPRFKSGSLDIRF